MNLVELTPLRNSLVGVPGSTGLSVEQRKRLTIAVELVANPSIIFMDEPTTGDCSAGSCMTPISRVCQEARFWLCISGFVVLLLTAIDAALHLQLIFRKAQLP